MVGCRMDRHFAPFVQRQRMASTVRRRSEGGTFACGRQASSNGSSVAHCASVSAIMPQPSTKPAEIKHFSDANRP